MADLEKTIDSTENTEVTTTSGVGDDFSLDFSDSSPQVIPESEPNLSEDSPVPTVDTPSSDLTENTIPQDSTEDVTTWNLSETNTPNLTEEVSSPNPIEENISTDVSNENGAPASDSLVENLSNLQPDLAESQQATNNEISLWKFEDEPVNTVNAEETNEVSANPVETTTPLEQPTINENPLTEDPVNSNLQDQEKNKLTPKEKLAQLIKTHESKAEKNWFTKWILSGIALTIVIVLAWFIFAKDQILDLINKIDGSNQQLTANVVEITNTTDEEVTAEDKINDEDEDINNEEMVMEDYETNLEDEFIDEEFTDEDIYDDEIIDEDNIIEDDEIIDEDNIIEDDEIIDEDNIIEDEDTQIDDSESSSYNITHVDSESEANWVLPAHCSDLNCYGEGKEFTPCTTFRQSENLDENANRIWKNWVCKYKDSSELVFIELK